MLPATGETFWYVSNGVSKPFFAALLALFARGLERGASASSCSGSTTPLGTPRRTWSCLTGSSSSTCPGTHPNCSPPSTSGPSWMSHSPTSISRALPISQTLEVVSLLRELFQALIKVEKPSLPAHRPPLASHV
jgi:hypothetical protein